jgi:hypothetical protein
MKFKSLKEPIGTSDPYYDLFDGGYFKPEKLLADKEEIVAINAAIKLIKQYLSEAEEQGAIELI